MKKYFFIAIALIACALGINAQNKIGEQKAKQQTKTEVTFHIVTMHGEHCKKYINENIAYEKGVKDMTWDLPNQNVTIEYNAQKTTPETLKASIEKLGYEVAMPQKRTCGNEQQKSCCRSH